MAEHFLTKTQIDLRQCVEGSDGPVLEAYAQLNQVLRDRVGPDTAQLFAEPLLSRGNDQVQPSVSWYTDVTGTAKSFGRLDEAQQSAITAELTRLLAPLRDLLDEPETGPLIAAALCVSDPNDVWSVDGVPVIIGWGMLPVDLSRDAAARAEHYNRTMGRFLPLPMAPPLTATEREALAKPAADQGTTSAAGAAVAGGAAAAAATMAATGASAAQGSASQGSDAQGSAAQADGASATAGAAPEQAAAAVPPPPAAEPPRDRPVPIWAWLPLVLLLLIFGGTLLWLLVPGNRIFPDDTAVAVDDETALAASADVNRALRERLADLENALAGAVCEADGTLLMPNGRTIEGLLPPDPNDRTDVPGAIRPADRTAILPPDPERVQVPAGGDRKDTRTLLSYIEERTAIVLAPSPGGLASGTGFFVGPDLLVTNFHVIAAPGANAIYVTNKDLGTIHQAQVLKSLGPFETTGGDFALLRVPGANQPAFTVLDADETLRLQSVIAAGYPGDLLESDAKFQQLRTGDQTAVPELSVTDGTVSAEQTLNDRARVVVHSAPISQGNSGGPLIDMCGRLVGVNTFVKKGSLRNLNFALSTSDLNRFLADTGALPQVVTQVCSPQVRRPAAPDGATAALPDPQPVPAADGAGDLPKLQALPPKSE